MNVGEIVITTKPMIGDWDDKKETQRQWRTIGRVFHESNFHGLCYGVCHIDGTRGYYDPSEMIPTNLNMDQNDWDIISKTKKFGKKWSKEEIYLIIFYMLYHKCSLRIVVRDLFPDRY